MNRLILILNLVIIVFSLSVVIVSMKWLHDEEKAEKRFSQRYRRSYMFKSPKRSRFSGETDRDSRIDFGGMSRREMNRAIRSAQKFDLEHSDMRKKTETYRKGRIW